MKIQPKNVESILKNGLKNLRAAMLVGNDEALMSSLVDKLCVLLGNECHNKVRMPASSLVSSFNALLNEVATASFFGGNKVVVISDITQPSLFPLLRKVCEQKDNEAFLIMLCPRILGDATKAFFEQCEHVAVLPCYLDSSSESAELECDAYVAMMFEKNFAQAELALEKLIASGLKAPQAIRCAMRYYNQLYQAQSLIASGVPANRALLQLKPRVFFKYEPAFNRALKEYSTQRVLESIDRLLHLEILAKTGHSWVVCQKKLYEILSSYTHRASRSL